MSLMIPRRWFADCRILSKNPYHHPQLLRQFLHYTWDWKLLARHPAFPPEIIFYDPVLAPRWQAQAQARLAGFEQASLRADRQRAAATLPAAAGAVWPPAEQTPERVAGLLRLAAPAGLRVLRSSEQAAGGGHLQLSVSASGTYAAMRAYLSKALAADTALVLQQVRLQRDDDDAAPLRIELRWVLLQDGSAPPRPGAAP
jgi:hypothetical protein